MEKNKYYTPDIKDLFIGYECELLVPKSTDPFVLGGYYDAWVPLEISKAWRIHDIQNGEQLVRTKYLDREDIERCGWSYNVQYDNYTTGSVYMLTWWKLANKWSIKDHNEPVYVGEIKSINELRKIMKMLKIDLVKSE